MFEPAGITAQKVLIPESGAHDFITPVITFFGGILVHFFGVFDDAFYALITFLIIDHLIGQMAARVNGTHSKTAVKLDLMRKFLVILLVGIANTIDMMLFSKPMIRVAIIYFYIGNQGISILAHAAVLGLPFPKKLREILEQFRDKGNSGEINQNDKTEAILKSDNDKENLNDEPKRLDKLVRTTRGKS